MIAKLGPSNILHRHALYVLHHGIPTSCFSQIREITSLYALPDPLVTLSNPPPSKQVWKKRVKTAVCSHWHATLVAQAAALPSLCYLRPAFIPLGRGAHPVWSHCPPSSTAVRAATIQARMLSGRYRTDWLRRHWGAGETGVCRLPGCNHPQADLEHLLTGACPAIAPTLATTLHHWNNLLLHHPLLIPIVHAALLLPPAPFVTFLLDPSTDPSVISLTQLYGTDLLTPLFRLSRMWVWAAHRQRLRLLGLHLFLL